MSLLELVAVTVTVAAVYLTTRQSVWCWPLSLLSVTLYGVVFFQARLYADMGLQGVYFVLSVYGWWAWLRGGEDHAGVEVSVASRRLRLVLAAVGAVAAAALGVLLARFTNAALPLLDSTLTAYSLVAQWLMARKLLDNWVLWIAVDVVYVGMFVFKGLLLTAGLYAAFIALAVLGLLRWRRSMGAVAEDGAAEATP